MNGVRNPRQRARQSAAGKLAHPVHSSISIVLWSSSSRRIAGAGLARLRPHPRACRSVASVILLIWPAPCGPLWQGLVPVERGRLPAGPVALVWGIASHFYIERFFRLKLTEEQRQLREAFAKYLSPQMLDRLTAEV